MESCRRSGPNERRASSCCLRFAPRRASLLVPVSCRRQPKHPNRPMSTRAIVAALHGATRIGRLSPNVRFKAYQYLARLSRAVKTNQNRCLMWIIRLAWQYSRIPAFNLLLMEPCRRSGPNERRASSCCLRRRVRTRAENNYHNNLANYQSIIVFKRF
jgi:hypothetical protein